MILHESMENYLKTLLILQGRLDTVRSIDVAHELGVTKPSVCVAVKKLREAGYVKMDDRHFLTLTPRGLACAKDIFNRHMIIETYLVDILHVDKETAHRDSCRLEHKLSDKTVRVIKAHVEAS